MASSKESRLLSLPEELLVMLLTCVHNIEDFMNLSSTCMTFKRISHEAPSNLILRLAAAQTRIFFRPSPHFLVAAVARELGEWARQSDANEVKLVDQAQHGIDGLLDLALDTCGLTMERIRQLHLMRFSIINPITDIFDKCVGKQWYALSDFWNEVDDAYTIHADPPAGVFHLAIYGELFSPDLESFLDGDSQKRRLSVETRLEYVKYCIPDFATGKCVGNDMTLEDGTVDPRRAVKKTGPYAEGERVHHDNNIGLTWVIQSSRWRPRWREARAKAGIENFVEDFEETWWYEEDDSPEAWRQRLLETLMVCQGLEGYGMILESSQSDWTSRIRAWREKIAALDRLPALVRIGRQATHEYPYLLGDLRIEASGYVGGT